MKKLSEIKDWKELINEVVQGDCLEGMRLIPDKSIDLILTDPPYGTTQIQWDKTVDYFDEVLRISKTGLIIFSSQPYTTDLIARLRGIYRYSWVWNKGMTGNFALAKHQPLKIHEEICVFGNVLYNPMMRKGRLRIKGTGVNARNENTGLAPVAHTDKSDEYYPVSILDFPTAGLRSSSQHPTQKPVDLIAYLLQTFTKETDLICDPFMGSWTTARACKDLGRNFIGFELEEKYCKVGEERLRQQNLF